VGQEILVAGRDERPAVARGYVERQIGIGIVQRDQAQPGKGRQLLDERLAQPADAGKAQPDRGYGSITPLT
jgi:hypothetical protein